MIANVTTVHQRVKFSADHVKELLPFSNIGQVTCHLHGDILNKKKCAQTL